MSKFYEALARFEHEIDSYAEAKCIAEIKINPKLFDKIRWVIRRELEIDGKLNSMGDAFGYEGLSKGSDSFKCRGISFVRGEK